MILLLLIPAAALAGILAGNGLLRSWRRLPPGLADRLTGWGTAAGVVVLAGGARVVLPALYEERFARILLALGLGAGVIQWLRVHAAGRRAAEAAQAGMRTAAAGVLVGIAGAELFLWTGSLGFLAGNPELYAAVAGERGLPAVRASTQVGGAAGREAAVRQLARMGNPAAPEIVGALRDPSPEVRREAAMNLSRDAGRGTSEWDATGVSQLIVSLSDPELSVRLNAATALQDVSDPAATLALIRAYSLEPNERNRIRYDQGLSRRPAGVPEALAACYVDPDPRIRAGALHLAPQLSRFATALPPQTLIGDPDARVRLEAVRAFHLRYMDTRVVLASQAYPGRVDPGELQQCGPAARPEEFRGLVPRVVRAARDPDREVRAEALECLAVLVQNEFRGRYGVGNPAPTPPELRALLDPTSAAAAAAALRSALQDPDPQVRMLATILAEQGKR